MVALTAQPNRHDDHNLPLDCVLQGDCLEILRKLPDNSVDACVVDPPYGLGEVKDIAGLLTAWIQDEDDKPFTGKKGFMGKEWDSGVPGPRYWREVLRVLKPGAHILCFAGTRTVDLMTIALRLSGFQIKDTISWLYGAGFPKSLDISKQIDKLKGAEREVIGYKLHARDGDVSHQAWTKQDTMQNTVGNWGYARDEHKMELTAPATDAAKRYNGYGTALKPAHEPIILARKPLSEKSIAENVLVHGTGAINIDQCRINPGSQVPGGGGSWGRSSGANEGWKRPAHQNYENSPSHNLGRFPSNLLLSHTSLPVLGLRERIPNHIDEMIRGYFHDYQGYCNLQLLQQRVPDTTIETPSRARQTLQQSLPKRDTEDNDGAKELTLWGATYTGGQGCNSSECTGEECTGAGTSNVEERELHRTGWISVCASLNESSRGTRDRQTDADSTRLRIGTPSSDGNADRQTIETERVCTPHQRGQTGQPTGELDDNERCAPFKDAQSDRAEDGSGGRGKPPLKVLAHDVPPEWLQYFEFVENLGCVPQGTKRVRGSGWRDSDNERPNSQLFGREKQRVSGHYADPDGYEDVEAWLCSEDCPIAEIDRQSGIRTNGGGKRTVDANPGDVYGGKIGYKASGSEHMTYGDTGGASRYFSCFSPDIEVPFLYSSKASRRERNQGCEGLPEESAPKCGAGKRLTVGASKDTALPRANNHPTVKPEKLISWLATLITPPGGIILDPFAGSGTTGVCAVKNGFHFILVEQSAEYAAIAEARIAHAVQETGRREPQEEAWECHESCPVKILEQQSKGTRAERSSGGHERHNTDNFTTSVWRLPGQESSGYDDSKGGAARFFQQFPPDSLFSDEEVR